jgi:hypothetical protein
MFYDHLVHFLLIGNIFSILVSCTKNNLATLETIRMNAAWLPDGKFPYQKSQFLIYFGRPWSKKCYGHLVYFCIFCKFWGYLVEVAVIWYIFPNLVWCTEKNLAIPGKQLKLKSVFIRTVKRKQGLPEFPLYNIPKWWTNAQKCTKWP